MDVVVWKRVLLWSKLAIFVLGEGSLGTRKHQSRVTLHLSKQLSSKREHLRSLQYSVVWARQVWSLCRPQSVAWPASESLKDTRRYILATCLGSITAWRIYPVATGGCDVAQHITFARQVLPPFLCFCLLGFWGPICLYVCVSRVTPEMSNWSWQAIYPALLGPTKAEWHALRSTSML